MANAGAHPARIQIKVISQMRQLFIVIAVTGLLSACGKGGPAGPTGMALPVTVIEASPQKLPMMTEAVGQAEGSRDFEVRARVSGVLEKQLYAEGESVKAGAPLFQIEPTAYQAAYDQAKAALDQARREFTRLKPLLEHRAISQKEFDDAGTALQSAEARAREASLNLSYAYVAAPFGGVTGRAAQSLGTQVGPASNSLLTTITQADPIWVRFAVSEAEYLKMRADTRQASVRLILPDGSTYAEHGRLNFAGSTVDTKLGSVQMRAEFPNSKLAVLPGQYVRARVLFGKQEVVLLPQPAVQQGDQGAFVWVVDKEGKAAPRPVETGPWQGSQWVITGGLGAGDKVVVDNLIKIRPGAPLAPHPPQATPVPGNPPAAKPAVSK
jgi:membrane fusion protein (multidrug efflux system)